MSPKYIIPFCPSKSRLLVNLPMMVPALIMAGTPVACNSVIWATGRPSTQGRRRMRVYVHFRRRVSGTLYGDVALRVPQAHTDHQRARVG